MVNRFQENQKSTAREKVARAARVAVAACDFADLFLQVPMESQWIQHIPLDRRVLEGGQVEIQVGGHSKCHCQSAEGGADGRWMFFGSARVPFAISATRGLCM